MSTLTREDRVRLVRERDEAREALREVAELAAHPNSDPRIREVVARLLEGVERTHALVPLAAQEYRVVNDDGREPSETLGTLPEAEECLKRRLDLWPGDGPQKIQYRGRSQWADLASTWPETRS
jgi:hypothetical protein